MVCERQTLEHLSGLAKSLETPTSVWTCLSLHFLTAQSRVAGRSDRPRIHSSDRSSMSSHLCVTPRQTDHMPEKDFIRGVHFSEYQVCGFEVPYGPLQGSSIAGPGAQVVCQHP